MRYSLGRCRVSFALNLLVVSLAAEAQPTGKGSRIGYLSLQGEVPRPIRRLSCKACAIWATLRGPIWSRPSALRRESRATPRSGRGIGSPQGRRLCNVWSTGNSGSCRCLSDDPHRHVGHWGPGRGRSRGQPGAARRDIAGLSTLATDLSGKRLELLKEAIPTLSRVAVLWNAAGPAMTRYYTQTQAAAQA